MQGKLRCSRKHFVTKIKVYRRTFTQTLEDNTSLQIGEDKRATSLSYQLATDYVSLSVLYVGRKIWSEPVNLLQTQCELTLEDFQAPRWAIDMQAFYPPIKAKIALGLSR